MNGAAHYAWHKPEIVMMMMMMMIYSYPVHPVRIGVIFSCLPCSLSADNPLDGVRDWQIEDRPADVTEQYMTVNAVMLYCDVCGCVNN